MATRLALAIALVLAAWAVCSTGQEQQKPEAPQSDSSPQVKQPTKQKIPTGTLTGTVYCADTNLPARNAQILLVNTSGNAFDYQGFVMSDLEGRFATKTIRAGDYYVIALLPGYVNLLSTIRKSHLDSLPEEERKKLLAQVPSATISPDQPAQVSIRLERGAEIDGTAMYDDGSPAIALEVDYKSKTPEKEPGSQITEMMYDRVEANIQPIKTDDRGRFRILGIPPGEYLVSVTVPTMSAEAAEKNQIAAMLGDMIGGLRVYVGGELRANKATSIKVDGGGASNDADITIPLSKLHTVHGQVILKSTGQHPPAAMVQLLYADTKELARMAIAPDGEFEMPWVPEGSFILRAAASPEPLPNLGFGDDEDGGGFGFIYSAKQDVGELPGAADLPLIVAGDIENAIISVPDPPANSQNAQGSETPNAAPGNPDKSQ